MNAACRIGFVTEIEFTLPKGYVDSTGVLHRDGVMRLATAADEILPLRDPRVQQNAAYLTVIVLSRVILRLGGLSDIDTRTIEGLFASDLDYLQRLYERLNGADDVDAGNGGQAMLGGSLKAYPRKQLYEEMAFIAFHLHWGWAELMGLEHAERRRWCQEVSAINRKLDGAAPNPFDV